MGYVTNEELDNIVNQEASSSWIRLGDGESVSGVLVGQAYEYHKFWDGAKSVVCTLEGGLKVTNKVGHRFLQNFATIDGEIQLFEGSKTLFKRIRNFQKLNMQEGPLAITIKREGEGMDTEYSVDLAKNRLESAESPTGYVEMPIPADQILSKLDETRLHDLAAIIEPQLAAFEAASLVGGSIESHTTF